jgi:hypothetical protein
MHKIIGAVLVIVGLYLLLQGHDLDHSFHAPWSRLFAGSSSGKVGYYYLGGALCCAVGLVEFFRPERK